ncbi:hypothetical protein V8E36_001569 [Tilletia maclaganii]
MSYYQRAFEPSKSSSASASRPFLTPQSLDVRTPASRSQHHSPASAQGGTTSTMMLSTPASTLASSSTPASSLSDSHENHPPRPPNSWMLYRAAKARELARDKSIPRPARRNVSPSERPGKGAMTRVLAEMWKNESPMVRKGYNDLAKRKKEEHQAMYPGYRYQPRRKEGSETTSVSSTPLSTPSKDKENEGAHQEHSSIPSSSSSSRSGSTLPPHLRSPLTIKCPSIFDITLGEPGLQRFPHPSLFMSVANRGQISPGQSMPPRGPPFGPMLLPSLYPSPFSDDTTDSGSVSSRSLSYDSNSSGSSSSSVSTPPWHDEVQRSWGQGHHSASRYGTPGSYFQHNPKAPSSQINFSMPYWSS